MAEAPVSFPLQGRKVFVAGHGGMVGSAPVRRLERTGCEILRIGLEEGLADAYRWFVTEFAAAA